MMHPKDLSDRPIVVPDEGLMAFARDALAQGSRFQMIDKVTGESVDVPDDLLVVFNRMLAAMANNQAISLVPTSMELTTNQAADLLNVSRTFVINLIKAGELPHRLVGTHRRVALADALAYRDRMDQRTGNALDELATIDQGLGLND